MKVFFNLNINFLIILKKNFFKFLKILIITFKSKFIDYILYQRKNNQE